MQCPLPSPIPQSPTAPAPFLERGRGGFIARCCFVWACSYHCGMSRAPSPTSKIFQGGSHLVRCVYAIYFASLVQREVARLAVTEGLFGRVHIVAGCRGLVTTARCVIVLTAGEDNIPYKQDPSRRITFGAVCKRYLVGGGTLTPRPGAIVFYFMQCPLPSPIPQSPTAPAPFLERGLGKIIQGASHLVRHGGRGSCVGAIHESPANHRKTTTGDS